MEIAFLTAGRRTGHHIIHLVWGDVSRVAGLERLLLLVASCRLRDRHVRWMIWALSNEHLLVITDWNHPCLRMKMQL